MARVLVVEDQAENLDLMVYLLHAFGHQTLVARDGAEGMAVIARDRPDLVVMDLQMPVIDGYEAASLLKADPGLASIPLVAVTAYAMVGDRDRIMAAVFDGYLTKPIDPQSFVRDVERYLAPRAPEPGKIPAQEGPHGTHPRGR
jgi:two-component system cell cycle response regulator